MDSCALLCGLLGWTSSSVCHEHKRVLGLFDVALLFCVMLPLVRETAFLGVRAWACRYHSILLSGIDSFSTKVQRTQTQQTRICRPEKQRAA
jgi:hypothetical protein